MVAVLSSMDGGASGSPLVKVLLRNTSAELLIGRRWWQLDSRVGSCEDNWGVLVEAKKDLVLIFMLSLAVAMKPSMLSLPVHPHGVEISLAWVQIALALL
ncbi:hypothetical protein Nepgr_020636 [Nepenthes gracilis]|uniref:Uncharacterized protein n=1 Tax=Nepenthes gracilis TaxID=150966 RepID=A0AAD3XWG2_NEPGR|nr:hypothetical protein Nepgr_020636 [Nepenthes gracilis]